MFVQEGRNTIYATISISGSSLDIACGDGGHSIGSSVSCSQSQQMASIKIKSGRNNIPHAYYSARSQIPPAFRRLPRVAVCPAYPAYKINK